MTVIDSAGIEYSFNPNDIPNSDANIPSWFGSSSGINYPITNVKAIRLQRGQVANEGMSIFGMRIDGKLWFDKGARAIGANTGQYIFIWRRHGCFIRSIN